MRALVISAAIHYCRYVIFPFLPRERTDKVKVRKILSFQSPTFLSFSICFSLGVHGISLGTRASCKLYRRIYSAEDTGVKDKTFGVRLGYYLRESSSGREVGRVKRLRGENGKREADTEIRRFAEFIYRSRLRDDIGRDWGMLSVFFLERREATALLSFAGE